MSLPQNLLYPIDSWTTDDVKKWFEYCIEEYSLGIIDIKDFQMNGKALLLLDEDGFKQRSSRFGDILHKALQQHNALIKSATSQTYPYQFWNNFPYNSLAYLRYLNIPFSSNYIQSAFNYKSNISNTEPIKIDQSEVSIKQEPEDVEPQPLISKNDNNNNNDKGQIRYYQDRIHFHGEILMKPKGAKNCRILWEFLYILLEDPDYKTIIHWENRDKMIFRIVQADKLAALWGLQKNRLSMTYEKLSRGMRYYYSNNIISKEQSKRLLYRFMRSPDEIRQNLKQTNQTNTYLNVYSSNFISKSDRSSSSSPESIDSHEKQYSDSVSSSSSSLKRKQSIPISLANRFNINYPIDQPMNLVKQQKPEHTFNYKKQRLIHALEQ